jgi:hypothetical protein
MEGDGRPPGKYDRHAGSPDALLPNKTIMGIVTQTEGKGSA